MKLLVKSSAVFAVLVLLLSGCSGSSDTSNAETPTCDDGTIYVESIQECVPYDNSGPVADPEPTEQAPKSEESAYYLEPNATCIVADGVDFEGYFEESGMYDYLNCIVPSIEAWIDVVYGAMPHPAAYVYVPAGVITTSQCKDANGNSDADDMSAFYCTADETVYIGQAATYSYYINQGDASMAMAMAHEVGHHFELKLGIYDDLAADGSTKADTIITENLADCISGAYLKYLNNNGSLNVADDIDDLAKILIAIADTESADREHGTLDERLASFELSFESNLENPLFACNGLYEGITVIE